MTASAFARSRRLRPFERTSAETRAGRPGAGSGRPPATSTPRASSSRRSSTRQQRRASRIAWHYLRDAADADEAVQDAFVKAYTHIASFQRNLSFEVWLTRILINGCLDRQKARTRRSRWLLPVADAGRHDQDTIEHASRPGDRSPEELLLAREWRDQLAAAVKRLPGTSASGVSCCVTTPIIRRAMSPR